MTRDPLTELSTRATPQSRPADARQVRNNAGGFVFQVTPWTRLDNETWAGPVHVHEALRRYRDEVNASAKLIAVGVAATNYTVADPSDAGQLDVSGFDSSVPTLINDFVRGDQ